MSYDRWAIVVMDRDQADWQARFLAELAEHRVTIAGGDLKLDDRLAGAARFEPLVAASPELAAWIAAGPRPYLGAPAGLFVWNHYAALRSEEQQVGAAIARAARGAVEQLTERDVRDVVVRRTFRLSTLLSEYGLDEGQVLLEREPGRYLDDAVTELRRVLGAHGIDERGGYDPESHSRLRVFPAGAIAKELETALFGAEIELWGFARFTYEDDPFWIDADP